MNILMVTISGETYYFVDDGFTKEDYVAFDILSKIRNNDIKDTSKEFLDVFIERVQLAGYDLRPVVISHVIRIR